MFRKVWLPILLAFGLVAAACGGDTDERVVLDPRDVAEETAEPSAGEVADEPAEPAAGDPTEEPADEPGPTPDAVEDDGGEAGESSGSGDEGDDGSMAEEAPVELTATARGVTADTITLGIAITDVTVFAPVGDILPRYQPLVDATNAAGGIHGRQVEMVTQQWDVLDQTAFDEACVALTEDNEVFLVIGFLISGFSNVPCYTDIHDTIVINTTLLEPDDIESSNGRLMTTIPDQFSSLLAGLELLGPELSGAKVVIYSAGSDFRAGATRDALEALGADILELTEQQIGGQDLVAAESEIDTHVERWRALGAEWIINADGSVAGSLAGLQRAGLTDLNIVSPANNVEANTALGADLSVFPNLIATGAPVQDQLAADGLYGIPECLDLIREATGQDIIPFAPAGEDQAVGGTIEICAAWDLFVTFATAAGPNLTPETFLQAGYDIGTFPMTGSPSGTFSQDKVWVSDAAPALFVYDAEADTFAPR